MTRKDFSCYIKDRTKLSTDKIIEVVVIEAGDFTEGIITKEEILRCYETMKDMNLPIYYSHQRTSSDLLGFVEKVWLDNEKIMATIKLNEDTETQRTVLGHIRRGNITHVSLGFRCSSMMLYEGKEMLTDIRAEEISIVGLYPETAVCPTCTITQKNFSETEFENTSDNELLLLHIIDKENHNKIVEEMHKRKLYHG